MSEETPPAKKAARKTVRKKSATKRAPRKSAKKETSNPEEQLPLAEAEASAESDTSAKEPATSKTEDDNKPAAKKARGPKSGVRDARKETADEPIPDEVAEKLVPDEDSSEEPKKKTREPQRDQNRSEQNQNQNERRGRGRGRNRERGEKREPKPRLPVDSKDLAKKAWKIFESEVTEEGLALLDDNGLRDYARSSFNAARLFLEEKGRVVGRQEQEKKAKKKEEKDKDKDDD